MEYGKNPPEHLVAQFYRQNGGVTPFDNIKTYNVRSLQSDAVFGDQEGETMTFQDQFAQTVSFNTDDQLQSIVQDENEQILQTQFPFHEQEVIRRITKNGQSFSQVGLSLGVSTADIKKIMRRWLKATNQEV